MEEGKDWREAVIMLAYYFRKIKFNSEMKYKIYGMKYLAQQEDFIMTIKLRKIKMWGYIFLFF